MTKVLNRKPSAALLAKLRAVDQTAEWDPATWYLEFQIAGGYVTSKGIGWCVRDHEVTYFRSRASELLAILDSDARRYLELRHYLDMRKVKS